jgi:hypothetical protein
MRGGQIAIRGVLFTFIIILATGQTAWGQEPAPADTEMERLLQCDKDLCGIVTNPSPGGEALKCDLTVTWHKEEIAKAVETGRISWPFGDARCAATLDVSRDLLASAIREQNNTLSVPPQPVRCEVDNDGSRHEVTATMAPVIVFKDGKAASVSLGLDKIAGSKVISSAVWAAWKLESYFGYFQEAFVKGVNGYIANWCPTREEALKEATPK